MFGSDCSRPCPSNCQEQRCDIVNGSCLGCKPGWTGEFCSQPCKTGFYGVACKDACSWNCASNVTCNNVNGYCGNGCVAGWLGNKCDQACADGKYGVNCFLRCSGNCRQNKPCNRFTGYCNGGCIAGYADLYCNKECLFGLYGENCSKTCSTNCKAGGCHHVTGNCKSGCEAGYQGQKCDKICVEGRYGDNCSRECSSNCINHTCDHEVGSCKNGCMPGWRNLNCTENCLSMTFGKNCEQKCSSHCANSETCNHVTGFCDKGCADGYNGSLCNSQCSELYFGINCSNKCSENCTEPCDPVTGICECPPEISNDPYCRENILVTKEPREIRRIDELQSKGNTVTVGVSVGTSILFIIFILSAILFLRFRKKWKKERLIENEEMATLQTTENIVKPSTRLPEPSDQNKNDSISSTPLLLDSGYANDPRGGLTRSKKTIFTKDLEKTIEKMSQDDDAAFKNEYKQIRKGELHPCLEAKKPENVPKNRYKTTYPYDHSRVALEPVSPDKSDYINANYIEDLQGRRSYIATQGPKPTTLCDFWSILWQENLNIIVCLTNLKEGTKIKCAQYWADPRDSMKIGEFTIRNQSEKEYANYIRRSLRLKKNKVQKERMVEMFHYTKWPDHGVPNPLSLVIFHQHVMRISEYFDIKYIVVHCSAGVGRTGTYIALDALYREGLKTGKVNVPKYVEIMRKDRMNMIQGHDQYKVVYLTLFESFRGKPKCLSTDQFLQEYQGSLYGNKSTSQLQNELKQLEAIKPKYSDNDFGTGRANIEANFSTSVLPIDEYMCRLSYVKDRGTYYNAVCLQSFTTNDSLISAQFPLPDYTEDFLRLLKDFSVHTVVSMCPLKDIKSSALWFPFHKRQKKVGPFSIKFIDSTTATNTTTTKIELTKEGSSATRLTVLECTAWKEGISDLDHRVLLGVVKETQIEDLPSESKIVVLSSDGAKRCGPFCVVYSALQQISLDTEVDVFTITRVLQIRRPEFISTLDEYQLCHDALTEYLQNDSVYANC
ncbi:receptor-type tyrosine-protein phosphatase alpha-like [Saccostrea cucullata]|uniref:receptor-type tyrosine-protein phosphatase alpha-like n=1 Tax=Saccostrea cuccullata TaxID=36930 RepID=UPI002ED4992F